MLLRHHVLIWGRKWIDYSKLRYTWGDDSLKSGGAEDNQVKKPRSWKGTNRAWLSNYAVLAVYHTSS
jgi:hypothetical protein